MIFDAVYKTEFSVLKSGRLLPEKKGFIRKRLSQDTSKKVSFSWDNLEKKAALKGFGESRSEMLH